MAEEPRDRELDFNRARHDFFVVGVGASAGGISALRQLFASMPTDIGMAFVVILHLSPQHESNLAALIQSQTRLRVTQVTETVTVEPQHVYVIPPSKYLVMMDGKIRLTEPERSRGGHTSIDLFFRTLGDAYGKDAIAILLSGTGADGALGIGRVKEEGGLVIAQDPAEAEYPDIPRAAIETGLVDLVLPAGEMAAKLQSLRDGARRLQIPAEPEEVLPGGFDDATLRDILVLVRLRSGNDFSQYKRPTLLRRITRRMEVNDLPDLAAYRSFLREKPDEIEALLRDLLITVTNFFRDHESFDFLAKFVIPNLFAGKQRNDQVRVWSAGCATGEEAYSLAMLLAEHAAKLADSPKLQLFATDIDERALAKGRECRYPGTIAMDVSAERLQRFFDQEGDGYRIKKFLRELILLAPHNVLRDPPYSRLDLICCRNLLIYLNREMQERVLAIFHFALRDGGYLFLGGSETAEQASALYSVVDKKHRIYRRRNLVGTIASAPSFPVTGRTDPTSAIGLKSGSQPTAAELRREVVDQVAPPSILVDDHYEVVHIGARASRYLQISDGDPTRNLLKIIHPDLRLDLRAVLLESRTIDDGEAPPSRHSRAQMNGETVLVTLRAYRVVRDPASASGHILVVFEQTQPPTPAVVSEGEERRVDLEALKQLEDELQNTKDQLRNTIEQNETSTEELRASNEELQAINEELRSASEELETSKEELQSVNEELTTVNQEYREKIEEVGRANSDLQNLMASTNIGTIFLDRELQIKRYTPLAQQLFNITAGDIGRPLEHFTHKLDYQDLNRDAEEVLRTLQSIEREVRGSDDHWYMARLAPYRTVEDKIDGVVLTFIDLTVRKQAEEALVQADHNKDRFLTMLAHELRNPLGAMFSSVEILERSESESDPAKRARAVIRRQLTQVVAMVDDLLDIERLNRGKIVLARERFAIGDVIAAALEDCRSLIDSNTHQFTSAVPAEPLYVTGDPTRLTQVFSNLLSNAFKYTPVGGRIELAVEQAKPQVIIRVRDNGIGIASELLPKLFDMYEQGEQEFRTVGKGLGVGLAVTKWLVDMHAGTVEARSEGAGKGSEFIVRLPLSDVVGGRNVSPRLPPRPQNAGAVPSRRILVIDDNRDGSDALNSLLTIDGHKVSVAYDGPSGFEIAAKFQPEVVLVDIGLPVMDGFEAAGRLREIVPHAVLVAISGWIVDEQRTRTAGFKHSLRKPIDLVKLNEILTKL